MFYSTQILARKGPLGIVWMAAHVERKLNRNQVHEASIPGTVDVLLSPEAPLALRLSGQLLLGVCRIYARKVSYLLQVRVCRLYGAGWGACRCLGQRWKPVGQGCEVPPRRVHGVRGCAHLATHKPCCLGVFSKTCRHHLGRSRMAPSAMHATAGDMHAAPGLLLLMHQHMPR